MDGIETKTFLSAGEHTGKNRFENRQRCATYGIKTKRTVLSREINQNKQNTISHYHYYYQYYCYQRNHSKIDVCDEFLEKKRRK